MIHIALSLSLIFSTTALTSEAFGSQDENSSKPCERHLTPKTPPTMEEIQNTLEKLETYNALFPGYLPSERVKTIYIPYLEKLIKDASQNIELNLDHMGTYFYLIDKLESAPFFDPHGSPNKGLHPKKAREVLRFYDPWEQEFLF